MMTSEIFTDECLPQFSEDKLGVVAYRYCTELAGISGLNLSDTQYKYILIEDLIPYLLLIIKTESPICFDEIIQRVVSASAVKKAGSIIQNNMSIALESMVNRQLIIKKGDFYYDIDQNIIQPRRRDATKQGYQTIAPKEIESLLLAILREYGSLSRETLRKICGTTFGYKRISAGFKERLDFIIDYLIKSQRIQEKENEIKLLYGSAMESQVGNLQNLSNNSLENSIDSTTMISFVINSSVKEWNVIIHTILENNEMCTANETMILRSILRFKRRNLKLCDPHRIQAASEVLSKHLDISNLDSEIASKYIVK